jgi:hypothetical protein
VPAGSSAWQFHNRYCRAIKRNGSDVATNHTAAADAGKTEINMNAESRRLQEAGVPQIPWKKWGPYLSER